MKAGFAGICLLFLLLFGAPRSGWAFPENVRNGYGNCTPCHFSPTGGGTLTPYGRELSREVLSTWGKEKESQFAYNAVQLPPWLSVGGDIRPFLNNHDQIRKTGAQLILMQADLEAAVTLGSFTIDGAIGHAYLPTYTGFGDHVISRRHFILWNLSDELSLRFGRFYPAYGIYVDNHAYFIRKDLGFDQAMESYNVEAAWSGEKLRVFATLNLGRFDSPDLRRETGFALQSGLAFEDRYQIGLSFLSGFQSQRSRHALGPYGILGFTPHLFLLTELDFQRTEPAARPAEAEWGFVSYQRLDYEWIQGLHTYLVQELSRRSFSDLRTLKESYGLGLQLFPRPHWELRLEWARRMKRLQSSDSYDFLWMMLHFYL